MTLQERNSLVMETLPIVGAVAKTVLFKSWYNTDSIIDDLIGEGSLALVLAADKWDPYKSKWKHYAGLRVKWAMLEYFRRIDDLDRDGRKWLKETGEVKPLKMTKTGIPGTEYYRRLARARWHKNHPKWSIGALRKGCYMAERAEVS